jgi:hypothetical protein
MRLATLLPPPHDTVNDSRVGDEALLPAERLDRRCGQSIEVRKTASCEEPRYGARLREIEADGKPGSSVVRFEDRSEPMNEVQ